MHSNSFVDQTRRQRQLAAAALYFGGALSVTGAVLLIFSSPATLWFVLGQLATATGGTAAAVGALAKVHADAQPQSPGILAVTLPLRQRFSPRQMLIYGLCTIAVLIAGPARRFRQQEWRTDLRESRKPVRYALGLVGASLRTRFEDLLQLLWLTACWVLSTELRTWSLLIPVMVAGLHQIMQSQGWGSALWSLPTVWTVHEVVRRLRQRWNVTSRQPGLWRRSIGRHARHRDGSSSRR
ncbi:hypothetical protein ABZ897_41605 [Nonomuraea sp. NPDC046802]|uniref:hypothetical protein n=1 Tax=Nonomuraea sp. NPDC046802 TaxID=3154919 RepID=UPI0033C4950A